MSAAGPAGSGAPSARRTFAANDDSGSSSSDDDDDDSAAGLLGLELEAQTSTVYARAVSCLL